MTQESESKSLDFEKELGKYGDGNANVDGDAVTSILRDSSSKRSSPIPNVGTSTRWSSQLSLLASPPTLCKRTQRQSSIARALFTVRKKKHIKEKHTFIGTSTPTLQAEIVPEVQVPRSTSLEPSILHSHTSNFALWPLHGHHSTEINKLSTVPKNVTKSEISTLPSTSSLPQVTPDLGLVPFSDNKPLLLLISQILESSPRFVFEGKILNRYGTFKQNIDENKNRRYSYIRYFKLDLVDQASIDTITLVISDPYIVHYVDKLWVGDYIRIEGAAVKPKNKADGGTALFSLHLDPTTIIIKAEPFLVNLSFCPETKIRPFLDEAQAYQGKDAKHYQTTLAFVVVRANKVQKQAGGILQELIVADGVTSADRATLSFVNDRKKDYCDIVSDFDNGTIVMFVARNIGAFLGRTNVLSVLDATILLPVISPKLKASLENVFQCQMASFNVAKQVCGTLEFININSILLTSICGTCKSSKIRRIDQSAGHCLDCNTSTEIVELPSLQAKITLSDRSIVQVNLVGQIVDKVLALDTPFKSLYQQSVLEARDTLVSITRAGNFMLDNTGEVIDYKELLF